MKEYSGLLLTLLQIIVIIGGFKGIEVIIKHFLNRKKNKTKDLGNIYKEFAENTEKYMKQTEDMQDTITDLRKESLFMGKRLIEMEHKLDEKNLIIVSLRKEVNSLNDETRKLKDAVSDLIKSKEILDGLKCEREDCELRIPAKNKRKIKSAKA